MRKTVVLITGAAGEIGQALIEKLYSQGIQNILALDIHVTPDSIRSLCRASLQGDILDDNLLTRIMSEYEIPCIYHLAALLSTRSEYTPELAHRVNVDGTLKLLKLAFDQASWLGQPVKFIFPSSVAIYGMPNLNIKKQIHKVKEDQYNTPITMYGCNKLYCEHLGRYYARHYRQLAVDQKVGAVDFRCLRFPGLISAFTVPTGGTSDYAPEMIHHAAQNKPYVCFVREDTQIPFMAMPDAVEALLQLSNADPKKLTSCVYNVTSFSSTASEIFRQVQIGFPKAEITFRPDLKRQAIVDSWPADQDDSLACKDWNWKPNYDFTRTFSEYLIPNIKRRYQ